MFRLFIIPSPSIVPIHHLRISVLSKSCHTTRALSAQLAQPPEVLHLHLTVHHFHTLQLHLRLVNLLDDRARMLTLPEWTHHR